MPNNCIKADIEEYVKKVYQTEPEYLWKKYPSYGVFRNKRNKKWFAVIMELPKSRINLDGEGEIFVINLKCQKERLFMVNNVNGILPAYHMNKENWLTVCLNGEVPTELVKELINESFALIDKAKGKK